MMFMGMAPFGSLLGGAVAERFGAPVAVTLGGLGGIAGAALFALQLPTMRAEARQLILALQASGGAPAEQSTGASLPVRVEKPAAP
jgi:hypothetical protein